MYLDIATQKVAKLDKLHAYDGAYYLIMTDKPYTLDILGVTKV